MKKYLFLLTILDQLLVQASTPVNVTNKEPVCNLDLLGNYNLTGHNKVNKTTNIICPKIGKNCCSLDD